MKKLFLLFLSIFLSITLNVRADSLSIFGGTFDYDDDNTTNLIGLNYHLDDNKFVLFDFLNINPLFGGLVTAKSATMLHGGFETNLYNNIFDLNLSSSAGFYSDGDGKDLGHPIQFKSEINLFYRLSKATQIGIGSHHISNAGLNSVNPGTNNYYFIIKRSL